MTQNTFVRVIGLMGMGAVCVAAIQNEGPKLPAGTTAFNLVVPPGFPSPPIPADNPLTTQGVALGQRLFNEVRLSGNNTESCATCHHPANAFSDEGKAFSVGITGVKGTRNAPALFDLAYQHEYFWDGRASTLREQSTVPITSATEMDETLAGVVQKLSADSTYVTQFDKAFGSPGVTASRIGLALEQYENTILAGNSKFDLVQQGQASFTQQERRGLELFTTPYNPRQGQFGADCARCHSGPLMSDFQFRNNGLDADPKDPGREDVTNDASDFAKFKTPSVRNLNASGPYMHDGRFQTLEQVVQHYSSGIQFSSTLDPGLAREHGGVQLTATQQADLVAFLKTLTDRQYTSIPTTP